MYHVGRFFYAIWRGLDLLRRCLQLLLLLALLGVLIGALHQSTPRLPEKAALVVKPSGDIVEQLSGEPIERAFNEAQGQGQPETLLWDLTTAIRAAASDPRIAVLVIDTDDMDSAGQAKLEELAAAIAAFRHSGKKIIARGTYFLKGQYYLAAQADEVNLDPIGFVMLDGYNNYHMFFRDALDKLSIDMHLFRAGKFKSAGETFTRRDMSPEDREESSAYLQSLWRGYRTSVASARNLKPEVIAQYADGYTAAVGAAGGDTAKVAKDAGLVSALKTQQEFEEELIDLVGADTAGKSYRQVSVSDYLRATHAEDKQRGKGPAVGVVVASGEILHGRQPPGTIGGETTTALLRSAREDPDIRAVVLRIDSPGGVMLDAEQIYREVLALKHDGKPVIASMSDVAASGGYYIAAGADQIIASPNSITGSIGVFASVPTFNRTLAKLGVNVDGIGTTPLAGSFRLDRPLSPELGRQLQVSVDHDYEEFLARVAKSRGKSREAIDAVAQGRVWSGIDARQQGLVDRLGGYDDAVVEAATRAGLKSGYGVRRIEPELSWVQQLLFQMHADGQHILAALGLARSGAAQLMQRLQPLDRELARWARLSSPNSIYAYCFCTAQ
ncbi:MAG TPA: signal peptide peptidase SppA [Steroidobacteraceae bacterium]